MTTFLKRGKDLFEIEEGKPLCRTDQIPQAGDQVLDGFEIHQVQANGELAQIQMCGGINHAFRARTTSEGGGTAGCLD